MCLLLTPVHRKYIHILIYILICIYYIYILKTINRHFNVTYIQLNNTINCRRWNHKCWNIKEIIDSSVANLDTIDIRYIHIYRENYLTPIYIDNIYFGNSEVTTDNGSILL